MQGSVGDPPGGRAVPSISLMSWTDLASGSGSWHRPGRAGPCKQTKGFGFFPWDSGKPLQDFKQESDGADLHFRKIIYQAAPWRRSLKQRFSVRDDFAHQGMFGNDWSCFWSSRCRLGGYQLRLRGGGQGC